MLQSPETTHEPESAGGGIRGERRVALKQSASEESLERKAGRLLFIGLPSTKLDRHWRRLLTEVRPGGVILFGRNVE